MISLKGKTALVTGSGKGIGSAIAAGLAECGADVAVIYHSSRDNAEKVGNEIRALGRKSMVLRADLSDPEDIKEMFRSVCEELGDVGILVNNSAIQLNLELNEYTAEDFLKIFNLNLRGYFLCMQEAVACMKRLGEGRIINISSIHSKRPTNFDPGYCMTKGAIKMLTREAAIEFAKYHINVNAVEPGAVEVGRKSGNPKEIVTDEMKSRPKLFRHMQYYQYQDFGMPEDVAPVVCFLASEYSRIITGASVRADGGSMLL